MAMVRRAKEAAAANGSKGYVPCPFALEHPPVFDFLTADHWPDGTDRVPGVMLICAEDGIFKLWLHDKDAGLQCWLSADSLLTLFVQAERAIEGSGGDWRPSREKKGTMKRRS